MSDHLDSAELRWQSFERLLNEHKLQEALSHLAPDDMQRVFSHAIGVDDAVTRFALAEWIGLQAPPPEGSGRRTIWLHALNNGCLWGIGLTGNEEARRLHTQRALAHAAENPAIFHNAAAVYCALGKADDAMGVVRAAKAADRLYAMAEDNELSLIRDLPEFVEIADEARHAAAEAHQEWLRALSQSHFEGNAVPRELAEVLRRSVGQPLPFGIESVLEEGTQPSSSGDPAFDDALNKNVHWCLRLRPLYASDSVEVLGFLKDGAGVVVARQNGESFYAAEGLWHALRLRVEHTRRPAQHRQSLELNAQNYETV